LRFRVFPYTTLFRSARLGIVGIPLLLASISFGQQTVSTSGEADRGVATVVEVIVTGSNIPTAEETGPNPVDTYRPADLEKLGIRSEEHTSELQSRSD